MCTKNQPPCTHTVTNVMLLTPGKQAQRGLYHEQTPAGDMSAQAVFTLR